MNTLLLDQANWDLTKDAFGNIALAREPYSIAQDVASAVRVFEGECWYDVTLGVPYLTQILGKMPPLALVKAKLAAEGQRVPEVQSIVVTITGFANRILTGQLRITDTRGNQTVVVTQETLPWYINSVERG